MNIIKISKNCGAQTGLGMSLALQCSAGVVGSGFPCKVAEEKTTGDKGKLFNFFIT